MLPVMEEMPSSRPMCKSQKVESVYPSPLRPMQQLAAPPVKQLCLLLPIPPTASSQRDQKEPQRKRHYQTRKYSLLWCLRKKLCGPFFLTDIFNNPFTHKQLEEDIRFSVFPGLPGNVSRQLEIFP